MPNEVFIANENREQLSLDEYILTLKEISSIIDVDKMDKKDKAFLKELMAIIDEMEVPLLIEGGEA